jgi:hypothetical protein
MSWHIFPSEQDIGTWRNSRSQWPREFQLSEMWHYARRSHLQGWKASGMAFTAGLGLSVDIPPGEVFIEGFGCENDETVNLSGLSDNATNYIWVRLLKTGGIVTGADYFANTSGVTPSEPCALIGKAVIGAPNYPAGETHCFHSQVFPAYNTGTILSTDQGYPYVFLGYQPVMVYCARRSTIDGSISDLTLGLSIGYGFRKVGGLGANALCLMAAPLGDEGVPGIDALGFTCTLSATGIYEVRWTAVV